MIRSLFLRFYLFIYSWETQREMEREAETQAPGREPDVGLDSRSPGSGPGLKAALNLWATQATHVNSLYQHPVTLSPWCKNPGKDNTKIMYKIKIQTKVWPTTCKTYQDIYGTGTPGGLSSWASAFGSGNDPRVLESSPTSGSLRGACFSLCLCLCLSVCLSRINK